MSRVVSLAHALNAAVARDGGKPRLTLYGPGGEYSDISSTVFRQWVAKTGNYMVEELQLEPGDDVALQLPIHWLSIVVATAAQATGMNTCDTPSSAAAVFSTTPVEPRPAGEMAAVTVTPLARNMPAGEVWWDSDFIHDVRASADAPLYEVSTPTLELAESPIRYLVNAGTRDQGDHCSLADLQHLSQVVAEGHSLVIVTDAAANIDRISAQEHVNEELTAKS